MTRFDVLAARALARDLGRRQRPAAADVAPLIDRARRAR